MLEVKISFTKIMCALSVCMAIASSAFALFAMGYHWSKWIVIGSVSIGVWIGFPSAMLALLRKLDDDRGRRGIYSYLDDESEKSNDRFFVIYPICTAILILVVLITWIGCVCILATTGLADGPLGISDAYGPLIRKQAIQVVIFCVAMSSVASLYVAYVQRGKGRFLVEISLSCGIAFLVLGLVLYVTGST